jgi:hypothetical protein
MFDAVFHALLDLSYAKAGRLNLVRLDSILLRDNFEVCFLVGDCDGSQLSVSANLPLQQEITNHHRSPHHHRILTRCLRQNSPRSCTRLRRSCQTFWWRRKRDRRGCGSRVTALC